MTSGHKSLNKAAGGVQPQSQGHMGVAEKAEIRVDGKRRLLGHQRIQVPLDLLGVAYRQTVDVRADLPHLRLGVLHEMDQHDAPADVEQSQNQQQEKSRCQGIARANRVADLM